MYGCSISELHDGAQLYTYIYWKAKTSEYFHIERWASQSASHSTGVQGGHHYALAVRESKNRKGPATGYPPPGHFWRKRLS